METFDALLPLLQAEGCLIESADRSAGVVAVRQVFLDGNKLLPSAGEIRRMSFLLLPAASGTEVRLTVYVAYQNYASDASAYFTEELGMATDPELYAGWFAKIDRALEDK